MQVVIASCQTMPEDFDDHRLLVAALAGLEIEALVVPWDEPSFDWSASELVAVRSTWDYTFRREEFLAWCRAIGPRLHNSAELIAWNSDKRYLEDLDSHGIPVVPTRFVAPGEDWAPDGGEVVIKPTISAGARDTGRFGPEHHGRALELVRAIQAGDRTAMVQPFQGSVNSEGETALAFVDGEFSHALRKRAVLAPDEVAPLADFGPRAAKAMYDSDLIRPTSPEADQMRLAERVIALVGDRFGGPALYGRVDMLRDEAGNPIVLELETVEPNLHLGESPGAANRLAAAIAARLG